MAQEQGETLLTMMKLLKYVYFAHGWTLGYLKQPLICHNVEAWKYGPVVPEIYHSYIGGTFLIRGKFINKPNKEPYRTELSSNEETIIRNVYRDYSKLTSLQLSGITHRPDAPWSKYDGKFYAVIPNEEIQAYYENLITQD
ncbi:MAG: Panacea domain-containing protein [Gammaproteobacteria bacterium WSBS_2016_MAG_OTU1]